MVFVMRHAFVWPHAFAWPHGAREPRDGRVLGRLEASIHLQVVHLPLRKGLRILPSDPQNRPVGSRARLPVFRLPLADPAEERTGELWGVP